MRSNRCPKCQGSMASGFILDNTDSGYKSSSWIEGAPEKSRWLGLKLRGKRRIEVETWRCTRCGFLESYAPAG